MKSHIYNLGLFAMLVSVFSRCEDFVIADPPQNEMVRQTVFNNDGSAQAATLNLYAELTSQSSIAGGWRFSATCLQGLAADELISYSATEMEVYFNNLLPTTSIVASTWRNSYSLIYTANSVIEGLNHSNSVSPSLKTRLLGEAKFVRAFCHFYLLNLYGEIPYIKTTDYIENSIVSRMSTELVYENIIQDLLEAELSLPSEYTNSRRIRPNKWTASALLSRVYLYSERWAEAEVKATEIINNGGLFSLVPVNSVFLSNSREAIWQLIPAAGRNNPSEGELFMLTSTPTNVALNEKFLNNFEIDDLRRTTWISNITVGATQYYFPSKYKANRTAAPSEQSTIFRLAEQYLIRAEARMQQDKLHGLTGAEYDINIIRNRAGLQNTVASTKEELQAAIMQERTVELFTEWGHRWFDLKRTHRSDAVLGSKPGWNSTDILWPLPQTEIENNSNLNPQNPGY